jgi:hypothetical protein
MTKGELITALAGVADDEELFVVSAEYDADDDATWGPETQTEIDEVLPNKGEVLLVLSTSGFE